MNEMRRPMPANTGPALTEPDVIIIGAGISGLYQLYRLRELGYSVQVFETGSDLGGTWYWNRYPGARFDSESYTYGYSFSDELLQEWSWSEHFAPQHETLRYLQHVADKFDLRRHIQFNSRVVSAHFNEASGSWQVTLDSGAQHKSRFLITALGPLSADTLPRIPGVESFAGQSFHTYRWPHEPVSFAGKRVAVIGTGATGVQVIQTIAAEVGSLTVFQRTPNWCAPLHNRPISEEEQRQIKGNYPALFALLRTTPGCYIHNADPRSVFEVTPEEREAFWEQRYAEPGFGIWQANYRDILTDPKANALISDFIARKIRQRVKNPKVAEMLIPKNHGFGTRRVPLETFYFEVYNQPNVTLVDSKATPIERITPTGIKTSDAEYEFDIIVYATGFDALRGAFDQIEFQGSGGVTLKQLWQEGATSLVGMLQTGMPNMFMLLGPHTALGNIPRSIEFNVEWVSDLLRYAQAKGIMRVEASQEALDTWMDHVMELAKGLLSMEVDSWMTGVNLNVTGKQKRIVARYTGSAPAYRAWANDMAARDYAGITMQ